MASELLKTKALSARIKEPKVRDFDFGLNLTSVESLIPDLPEPKPPELLDIQEQNRKSRLLDSLNKIGGGLEDTSLDFIKRENFGRGKIPFTAKQQKIAEAYVEARGMTIEELTVSQRNDIRDGMYTLETASETKLDKIKRAGKTRVLQALEESQAINPKTNKVYTPEEWLNLTYSKRTAEKSKALDPVEYKERLARNKRKTYLNNREKILEDRKDYYYDRGGRDKARILQEKNFKIGSLEGKGGFLRDEQNRLLKYMQIAADKGNKNFKIYKEDGKFAGVKDIKKNKLYRSHTYKGKKGIPITEHPNNKEVQYFLKQAKRFKTERPNQTLGSYFAKYSKTPTYSEIYSFLKLGDKASNQTRKQNRLEMHHRKTMAVSPTDNLQLALFDDNSGANKVINAYNNPESEFYKNKNYADKELKKLNINLKIPGTKSFIGSEVLSPEKSLAVAKRKTVNLLKKEIQKDPKVIERLIASIGCPDKGKADGGRIGFSEGTDCFNKGLKAVNEVKIKPGAQARNFAKFANRAYKLGRGIMKFGVIPEALFVGADSLIRMNLGDTLDESLYRAADFFIPGNQTDYADVLKIERTLGGEAAEVFRNVTKWKRKNEELQSLEQAEQADLALAGTDFAETNSGVSADETRKTYAGLKDKKRKEVLDASVSKDDQVLSQSYFDEAYDISKAKSTSAKIKGNVLEDESGLNVDLLAPEKNQQFQKIKNFREDMEFSEDDILKEINSNIQKGFYKNVEEAKLHYFQTLFAKKKFKEKPLSSFVLDDGYTPEQVYGTQGGEGFLNKINREKFIRPGTYEATPEEIDANFDMQDGIMAASGGRIGFAVGGPQRGLEGMQSRARIENTSEKIFNKLLEVAKTLESEEQEYFYKVVIPKTLIKLSADVGTKESQALRTFLEENQDLTKVDLSNIPLKFNDNTHLKTLLEIPLPSDIKAEITTDSSMTKSDLDKIEITSKNLDIEYDKKKSEIDTDLNFDIGKGDINLSNTSYLNDNINTSNLELNYPFKAGNLKAKAQAEDGNIGSGEIGYQDDGGGLKLYLDKEREPSISAYKDLDNINLNADLSLDKEDRNQIGVEYRPKKGYLKSWIRPENFNLFANQDIGEGGTTVGGDYTLFNTEDNIGNTSRFDIGARADLDGEKNAYLRFVKNFGLKDPGLQFQTNDQEKAMNFLKSRKDLFQSGGRAGFKDGPKNPGRRKFIKLAVGLASLPILGKFFKGAKVAKLIKPIPNSSTVMPDWFPNFVDKFVGRSIGKKIDADFMEYTNPDLPNIKLSKSDDGKILVEGRNEFNESYNISYEPPGYEVLDYKTGKAVKTKGEFEAVEGRHVALGRDDYDTDPFYAEDLDELFTRDIADMEKYTTGNVTKTVKDAFGTETGLKKGKYDVDMAQGQAENRADILRDEGLDEID